VEASIPTGGQDVVGSSRCWRPHLIGSCRETAAALNWDFTLDELIATSGTVAEQLGVGVEEEVQ
jgi:hypothetical protein